MALVPVTTNTKTVIIVSLLTTTLTILMVILRLYGRLYPHYGLGLGTDDILAVLSTLLLTALTALSILASTHGNGRLPLADPIFRSCILAHMYLYLLLSSAIRASVATFYLRLFPPPYTVLRTLCHTFVWGSVPFVGAFVLLLSYPDAIGLPAHNVVMAMLALSVAEDICIVLLPLPAICCTRLPPRDKAVACVLLTIGGAACVVTCFRLGLWARQERPGANAGDEQREYRRLAVGYWVAAQVEAMVALGGASLPALRPLWDLWRGCEGGRGGERRGSDTEDIMGINGDMGGGRRPSPETLESFETDNGSWTPNPERAPSMREPERKLGILFGFGIRLPPKATVRP